MNNGKLKVWVTYPDLKNSHQTDIESIRLKFSDEKKEWLESFIDSILKGEGRTKFGRYQLVMKMEPDDYAWMQEQLGIKQEDE